MGALGPEVKEVEEVEEVDEVDEAELECWESASADTMPMLSDTSSSDLASSCPSAGVAFAEEASKTASGADVRDSAVALPRRGESVIERVSACLGLVLVLQERPGEAGCCGASSPLLGKAGAFVPPFESDSVCPGTWLRLGTAGRIQIVNGRTVFCSFAPDGS